MFPTLLQCFLRSQWRVVRDSYVIDATLKHCFRKPKRRASFRCFLKIKINTTNSLCHQNNNEGVVRRSFSVCLCGGTRQLKTPLSTIRYFYIPKDWFGTPAWPPFHCFRTPIRPRDVLWKRSKPNLFPYTEVYSGKGQPLTLDGSAICGFHLL